MASLELSLRDLQITGAIGEYLLSAELGDGGKAHADVKAAWPAPPVFLPEILSAVPDSLSRDRLQSLLAVAWSGGGPLSAEIQADLEAAIVPRSSTCTARSTCRARPSWRLCCRRSWSWQDSTGLRAVWLPAPI